MRRWTRREERSDGGGGYFSDFSFTLSVLIHPLPFGTPPVSGGERRWTVFRFQLSPPKLCFQNTTCHNFVVGYEGSLKALAIQLPTLHNCTFALGTDSECLAPRHIKRSLANQRSRQLIDAATGFHLIQSHSRHHIPCRHLAYILIATDSIGFISVHGSEYLMDTSAGFVRLTDIIIYI